MIVRGWGRHDLEGIDNLNRPMSIKYIESPVSNFQKQKLPGLGGFTDEFYQILKKEIIPILYCLFRGWKEREYFLAYSMSPALKLIPKTHSDYKKITDQYLP